MQPTREQADAIHIQDRALLVEAGAGTGKTWVLVQRFLHLLDRHPEWPLESLLAVTFTEKAAREMRTRIRSAVEEAARGAPPASHWHLRRRELDRLQVGTLHSLCARLLREHAIAAGVDPRFAVLDEQHSDLLKDDALHQSLSELSSQTSGSEPPAAGLFALLQVRDLRAQLSAMLEKRGELRRLFTCLPEPPELLAQWREGLERARRELWQAQRRAIPGLDSALAALPQMTISDSADKLAAAVELAQAGCRALEAGDLAAACTGWLEIKLTGGKAANWGGKDALEELKEQLKTVRSAAQALEAAGCARDPGPLDEQAALALHLWRDLWQRVDAIYARLKNERHALDFDDLELLAEDLLYRPERDPRLQAFLIGIHHLMVDEFQDTNEVQQRIVYALAHPRDGGRLFVVGDAKQSIYRFRQAQVAVFNRTAQEIARLTGQDPIRLSRSFRTHDPLIRALNRLFDHILQPLGDQPAAYEALPGPLEAHRPAPQAQPATPAPVELLLLPVADQTGASLGAEETRVYEAQLLAQRLLDLRAQGFQVGERNGDYRPFEFGDAAILFRATTELPLYEEQFKAAGLPYLTVSGRGYYDRPEVQDLLALLACLYNPADDLSLATVLRSPLFSLSDETLYSLRWNTLPQPPAGGSDEPGNAEPKTAGRPTEPPPFFQALRLAALTPALTAQPGQVEFAAAVLDELWRLAGRVDVWRLLRTALDRTGYEATLALIDRDQGGSGRQLSNVRKLLELARGQGGAGLSDFLRSVQDLRAREAREGEAPGGAPAGGAVQLMSIHAAKGLEFPVVVVADLGRRTRRGGEAPRLFHDPAFGLVCQLREAASGKWQKPASFAWAEWLSNRMEAAESKRLLYVACTRAADLLILSGKLGREDSWLQDILAAWGIEPDGAPDELIRQDELTRQPEVSLRVLRPPYAPTDTARPVPPHLQAPAPDAPQPVPVLARPLPIQPQNLPLAVTCLDQFLDTDTDELPALRPLVRFSLGEQTAGQASGRRAPAFRVGRLVHRLLADWAGLQLPAQELQARLTATAHREGILHPQAVEHAAGRARRMLAGLRRSPLYAQVQASPEVYTAIPFTLDTPAGLFHGVLDLLYAHAPAVPDAPAEWRLVDWKTEWAPAGELEARARELRLQMAIYAEAARQTLGIQPVVSLCFLASGAAMYTYKDEELQAMQEEIFG